MSEKEYQIPDEPLSTFNEAAIDYKNPLAMINRSRQGVAVAFVQNLMESFQFTKQDISRLADISTKTIDRHIQSGKPFTGLQADRFVELADLYNEGIDVFGSSTKFIKWLHSTVPALGNTRPIEWLDTHKGIQLISDELGRIKHGIFA